MNRITREKIKKQREAKGFTGIQIKDLGKFFKRKEMQAPTPSGVTQKKTTTTQPSAKSGGRAEQMNKNAAGNKQSNTKSTTTKGSGNRAVTGKPNTAGVTSTSKATDAEVKAWKARKPNSMKRETWKGYPNVGAALNAWRKEDPRKK